VFAGEIRFSFIDKHVFTFAIKTQANERARKGKFGFYTPKKTATFKKELVKLLKEQWKDRPLEKALMLACIIKIKKPKSVKRVFPTVKPDCSNLIKGIEDAFNKILWKDDSVITTLLVSKVYSESDGIDLNVYTLE